MEMTIEMGGMMRVLEMVTVTILVVKGKEMINKGEMVGLALGCVGLFGMVRGGARVHRGRRR